MRKCRKPVAGVEMKSSALSQRGTREQESFGDEGSNLAVSRNWEGDVRLPSSVVTCRGATRLMKGPRCASATSFG